MCSKRELFFFVFTAVLYVKASESALHDNVLATDEANIIGGHVVKKGEIPYQVSIRSKTRFSLSKGHFCGGTIVDAMHIITGANCARYIINEDYFYVAAGSISLQDKMQIKKYEIKSVIIHKRFSKYTLKNNIALLKLKSQIEFDEYQQPIKIVKKVPMAGTKCIVSGWGTWRFGDYKIPDQLKAAEIPISNITECVANYSGSQSWRVDPKTMICAGFKKGGVDSCQGDSGGPLVCNNSLAGIISWGRGCAMKGYPGIYTSTFSYIDWLVSQGVEVNVGENTEDYEPFKDEEERASNVSEEENVNKEVNENKPQDCENENLLLKLTKMFKTLLPVAI